MAVRRLDEPDNSRNNGMKIGPGNPPVEHLFQRGNPGCPRGSRNKLGEDFIAALAEDFAKHGMRAIETVRRDQPAAYLKVIASLMPKDLSIKVDPYAT